MLSYRHDGGKRITTMLISVKPCVNCGASEVSDFREYDGCLGYEAIICKICGYIYDQNGAHAPEEEFPQE